MLQCRSAGKAGGSHAGMLCRCLHEMTKHDNHQWDHVQILPVLMTCPQGQTGVLSMERVMAAIIEATTQSFSNDLCRMQVAFACAHPLHQPPSPKHMNRCSVDVKRSKSLLLPFTPKKNRKGQHRLGSTVLGSVRVVVDNLTSLARSCVRAQEPASIGGACLVSLRDRCILQTLCLELDSTV